MLKLNVTEANNPFQQWWTFFFFIHRHSDRKQMELKRVTGTFFIAIALLKAKKDKYKH